MTLLGVPTFSVGSSKEPTMDMSLDEMIASRRKEQVKSVRGGGRPKISAADRSLGAGRAKRDAAVAARRGLRQTAPGTKAKPTAMEIEREVYRQARQTATSKARAVHKASRGRIPATTATTVVAPVVVEGAATPGRRRRSGRGRRSGGNAAASPAPAAAAPAPPAPTTSTITATVVTPRPPSKKAVTAAVTAMQSAGYNVPDGMQMVITFAPTAAVAAAPTAAPAAAASTPPARNNGRRSRGRAN